MFRAVLEKRCSENKQQIYRRTPMPKCDFNKVVTHWYGCSPVNFLHIFRTLFPRNTSGWLFLRISLAYVSNHIKSRSWKPSCSRWYLFSVKKNSKYATATYATATGFDPTTTLFPNGHSNGWVVKWLNGEVFVYDLSDCGFESRCSHLNFR